MKRLGLMTIGQTIGEKKLSFIKKYGLKSAFSDFAILLGGKLDFYKYFNPTRGCWWLNHYDMTNSSEHGYCANGCSDEIESVDMNSRCNGVRPTIKYSSIYNATKNRKRIDDDILEVEYGEYPQKYVGLSDTIALEKLFKNNKLKKTGKSYTTNLKFFDSTEMFVPSNHIEYEYKGKKYIRIFNYRANRDVKLSNGDGLYDQLAYWIEVQPIKWLVDEKQDVAVTKDVLLAGIPLEKDKCVERDSFDETFIQNYLDQYMVKDIVASKSSEKKRRRVKVTKKEVKTGKKKKDFTLLEKSQVEGENALNFIKKNGLKCPATDFAILLGAYLICYTTFDSDKGRWWLSNSSMCGKDYDALIAGGYKGEIEECSVVWNYNGLRPAINYSAIYQESSNIERDDDNQVELEYGEYPQMLAGVDVSKELEEKFLNNNLRETGKIYTTDSKKGLLDGGFKPMEHREYWYKGKKYVRVVNQSEYKNMCLSNGELIKEDQAYWIEVQPVKWLVDEKKNVAATKNVLLSGISYDVQKTVKKTFEETFIKKYLDNYFRKEIRPSKPLVSDVRLGYVDVEKMANIANSDSNMKESCMCKK